MSSPTIARWSRRFVGVGVLSLVLWALGLLVEVPARTEVVLALYGFVLHVVFGKAYTLVPSYFDRTLVQPRLAGVHWTSTVTGTACLALAPFEAAPASLDVLGGVLWCAGVLIFIGGLVWSIRDNLTGAATGTSGVNAPRQRIDRVSNAFVPVALVYLLFGSIETLASTGAVPSVFDGYPPRATHLLAAGTATLLVFAIGFRLLPRFLRAYPPSGLVYVVLPTGAVAPIALALTLPAGGGFQIAAALQGVAIVGYAIVIGVLFGRSPARRVALYGVGLGAVAGVVAVGIGVWMAIAGVDPTFAVAHRRLTLVGFLGLTIVGVSLQFYPPNVGVWPGCTDRTAALAMAALAGGLGLHAAGLIAQTGALSTGGAVLVAAGVSGYAYLIGGAFRAK